MEGYLQDAAKEMADGKEKVSTLESEVHGADMGLRRLADAVAPGALDLDAARQKTLELHEKKERASKRLSALKSGTELGEELRRALELVEQDLPGILASMDRGELKELVQLVLRRFTVEATGGPRNRVGHVSTYEFTPEFQDFRLTLSNGMVGGTGLEPVTSAMSTQYSNQLS